ncbi:hypothetical protein P280DRAFT_441676 [Massarina eburnea CBS 473.64]|uniref:Uncharacterized protein n=1 Tax=Massarina eburnea CBS 473.64 TaxID=1395130 RepID=A0A6A6SEN1_9PLEO|nr:hypothetical protein P280DRAFT_441676 [Massarina eburnea CBS 473.64]
MVALYCWNEPIFLFLARAGARLDIVNDSGHNIVQLSTWTASLESWKLISEKAKDGKLDCGYAKTLHDDHGIQHCFNTCRRSWYVGERVEEGVEKTAFDNMIRCLEDLYSSHE